MRGVLVVGTGRVARRGAPHHGCGVPSQTPRIEPAIVWNVRPSAPRPLVRRPAGAWSVKQAPWPRHRKPGLCKSSLHAATPCSSPFSSSPLSCHSRCALLATPSLRCTSCGRSRFGRHQFWIGAPACGQCVSCCRQREPSVRLTPKAQSRLTYLASPPPCLRHVLTHGMHRAASMSVPTCGAC